MRRLHCNAQADLNRRLVTCDCYSAGDYRTQFHAKAAAIADALARDSYDFGFLHVKAVDDTGHDKLLALKVSNSEFCGFSASVWRTLLCSMCNELLVTLCVRKLRV